MQCKTTQTTIQAQARHRVDAFGNDQNLESLVRQALDAAGGGAAVYLESDSSVEVVFSDNNSELEYETFRNLFSPTEGMLSDVPEDLEYTTVRTEDIGIMYDDVREVNRKTFSAEDIEEIRRKSVEESFTSGYDPVKFEEAYEEVLN